MPAIGCNRADAAQLNADRGKVRETGQGKRGKKNDRSLIRPGVTTPCGVGFGKHLPHLQIGEVLVDRQFRTEQAADFGDIVCATPIRNATGENIQPKTLPSERPFNQSGFVGRSEFQLTSSGPMPPRIASNIATKAINTISIAPTFRASCRPSVVPVAAASIAFTYGDFSRLVWTVPPVSGLLTSGRKSFG